MSVGDQWATYLLSGGGVAVLAGLLMTMALVTGLSAWAQSVLGRATDL